MRGFTLIEVLVVVVLISILASVVALSFTGANLDQELRGEAERAALRMELARSNALQRNREWGVLVEENSYRFMELDPYQAAWVVQSERPLAPVSMPENIRLKLETEGFKLPVVEADDAPPDTEDEREEPNLLVFSSGEVTPFELAFIPEWEGRTLRISSDGLRRIRLKKDEQDDF